VHSGGVHVFQMLQALNIHVHIYTCMYVNIQLFYSQQYMYVSRDVDACYVSWGGEDVNICINVYIHICDADVWRHIYLLSCFMC